MIVDRIENLKNYIGLSQNLDQAIHILSNLDLDAIPYGKVQVNENQITYSCDLQKTRSEQGLFYEAHQKYMDIHICLSGQERIRLANKQKLQPVEAYDEQKDIAWFDGIGEWDITLRQGEFLICFEEDAHMPLLDHGTRLEFKKLMVKIAY